ncbi:MAG: hypothetical protein HY023_06550 [Chloroflexi bacterium]|nr:hypothetical protein [Chloroflexota bacterium]
MVRHKKNPALDDLLAKGAKTRQLSEAEIAAAFEEPEGDEAQAFLSQLEDLGIEVVPGEEEESDADLEEAEPEFEIESEGEPGSDDLEEIEEESIDGDLALEPAVAAPCQPDAAHAAMADQPGHARATQSGPASCSLSTTTSRPRGSVCWRTANATRRPRPTCAC